MSVVGSDMKANDWQLVTLREIKQWCQMCLELSVKH